MIEQVSALKRKIEAANSEITRLEGIHAQLSEEAAARSAERGALESELAQVNEQLQAIELDRLVGRKVDEKVASKASALAVELQGRIAAVDVAPVKNSAAVAGLIDQEKAALKQLEAELEAAKVEHFMMLAGEEAKTYESLLKQVEESLARIGALHALTGKRFTWKDTDAFVAPRLHMDGEKVAADCFAVANNVHQYNTAVHALVQYRDAAKAAEAAFKAQIDAA
ncbi:hypothetical protein [Methylococcus capsulatus]|uniref:hypothetical protein n=1 Tax=Methylococcus capsulatus TaxID=414 RepID=UPI001C52AA24|nr:hypothetical protein [Methylococcus capsulatus]QXP90121.1 hypothetical protein KW114_13840 [Methylococcus capsulatus]